MEVVLFCLDDKYFGMPIRHVREVLRSPEISHLPQAPEYIEGVIHLRQHNVMVMNLRKRMGLPDMEEIGKSHVMMVKVGKMILGVLVDKVMDIQKVNEGMVDSSDQIAGSFLQEELIDGVVHHNEDTVFILNVEAVLNAEQCEKLESLSRESAS